MSKFHPLTRKGAYNHRLTESDALTPPNQYLQDDREGVFGWPHGERMPAVPEVFSIEGREESRPPLVTDIHDALVESKE